MGQWRLVSYHKHTTLVGDTGKRGAVHIWEQRACGKSPYLPLKFAADFVVVVFAMNFKWL